MLSKAAFRFFLALDVRTCAFSFSFKLAGALENTGRYGTGLETRARFIDSDDPEESRREVLFFEAVS